MTKRQLQPAPLVAPQQSTCRHCREPINLNARICYHCGQHQSLWFNAFRFANTISVLLLIVSIFQLILASSERADATDALKKAQLALDKVTLAEGRALAAQKDVVDVAEAVIQIAGILPHATGYGAGLTDSTRAILKSQSSFLNKKLIEFKKASGK
jgi:hypothetical protein